MENQFHDEMKLAREWLLMLLEEQETQRRERLRQIRTPRLEILRTNTQPLELTTENLSKNPEAMQTLSEGGAQ